VISIAKDGHVTKRLSSEAPWAPIGVAVRNSDLYVLEWTHPNSDTPLDWKPRVRRLARDGVVTTLASVDRP
jgi:hypothetical protein